MESSEYTYESKELQQLITFLNGNTPFPQQSVPETMDLLDQHALATCVEITMNMACIRGYEMNWYYNWWNEKIAEVNVKKYKQLFKNLENQELQTATNLGADTDELQLGTLFPEGMSQEEQRERCKFCLDLLDRYALKLNEVCDHLVKQFLLGTNVEQLPKREHEISRELERMHQYLYERLLDFLEKSRGFHLEKQDAKNIMEQLEMMFENQKKEINNNYYEFPAEITKPYLAQMNKIFNSYQQKIWKVAQRGPTFIPLRRRCLAQLKELRDQVQQFQEQQALHSYSSKLNDLCPEENQSFVSFLILYHMKGVALLRKYINDEPELIKIIANFININEPLIAEYLKITDQPVSTWNQEQQLQFQRVTEFVERRSAILEYKYPEEAIAKVKSSYW